MADYDSVLGRSVVPVADLTDNTSAANVDSSNGGIGKREGTIVYVVEGSELELYMSLGKNPTDTWKRVTKLLASRIITDTANFNNNLSVADDTVQKALDTLDNLVASGATNLNALDDVNDTDVGTKNFRLIHDGTEWRMVAEDTSFTFSIASFTATGFLTGTRLAGLAGATWLGIGAVTYSASYNNGPATSAYISSSGHSNLNLDSFVGPTLNAEAYTYPSAGSSRSVTLNATDGSTSPTSSKSATFHNYIRYSETSKATGFAQADFDAATESEITGDNTQTWNTVTLADEYWTMWIPTRVGRPTNFIDNGTGFALSVLDVGSTETVSIDNGNGLTENYMVIRSTNKLGTVGTPYDLEAKTT